MPHVSKSKRQTPEAGRFTPTIEGSRVEVGARHDGFYDSLAMTSQGHDVVWVIMDQLTKSAQFWLCG